MALPVMNIILLVMPGSVFCKELYSSLPSISGILMSEKALDWGIVNAVVEAEELEAATTEMAKKLAAGPPLTQKLAKSVFYYGLQADQRTGLFTEAAVSGAILHTADVNEGLTSLNYRRPA